MPKPKRELVKIDKPIVVKRKYSDAELNKFNGLVQKYYEDYTLTTGKDEGQIMRVLNKEKLMIAYGAINKDRAVLIDEVSFPPNRFQQFENLYEQWQWWKQRMGYGEIKKLESFEKVAEQMTIEPQGDQIPF